MTVSEEIRFPKKQEYILQAENITLRMLTYPVYSGNTNAALYAMHTHAHRELFACLKGSFCLQTERGLLTVNAGDIVIVPPDFPHCKLPSLPETVFCCLDFICVGRRRAGVSDLKKALSPICDAKRLLIAHGENALCREVAKAADLLQGEDTPLPAIRLLTVLTELAGKPLQEVAPGDTPHAPPPGLGLMDLTDISRLSRLDYLVNGCFTDPELSLSRAAKLLYISERHLERITRREYGGSFYRVLTDKRLDAAACMLTETALSPEEIGGATGFASKATFTRAFRARYGKTPTEYRKTRQQPR